MVNSYLTILKFEICMTMRQAYSWLTPLLFFIIIVCLFPLAIGPDKIFLNKIAPGVIWVAALLSIIISIDNLFRYDAEEGYLDQLLLSQHSLSLIVLCKVLSHWLTHCLPLIIISPLLGLILNLTFVQECALIITLLLGTPVFCLLGAIGAALIIGLRNHGFLLPILIMPLYIPVLIFGTGAIMSVGLDQPINAHYAIMAAILLLSFTFAPLMTSIALRIGVNY